MFYPNHHIRSYCRYLGSLEYNGKQLDMGVYEESNEHISHAIVYGQEDSEYFSGDISLIGAKYNMPGIYYKINILLYKNWLENQNPQRYTSQTLTDVQQPRK